MRRRWSNRPHREIGGSPADLEIRDGDTRKVCTTASVAQPGLSKKYNG
jgi:hypothetical protein